MRGILVSSHSIQAEAVIKGCEMILGNTKNCYSICLLEGVDEFSKSIYRKLDEMFEMYDEVIAVADLRGGTPFNQLLRYKLEKQKSNMIIISGFNCPLMIELIMSLEEAIDVKDLVKNAIGISQNSIIMEVENENDYDLFD